MDLLSALFQHFEEYKDIPIHRGEEVSLQFYDGKHFGGVLNDGRDVPVFGWDNLEEGLEKFAEVIQKDREAIDNLLWS